MSLAKVHHRVVPVYFPEVSCLPSVANSFFATAHISLALHISLSAPSNALPISSFLPFSLVVARTQIATKAAWSVVFAQEMLLVSAILLALIAFTLFMAVVSLSKIQYEEGVTLFTLPFWGVYFPIGLHGGWTLAGTQELGSWDVGRGGQGQVVLLALCKGLLSIRRIILDDPFRDPGGTAFCFNHRGLFCEVSPRLQRNLPACYMSRLDVDARA